MLFLTEELKEKIKKDLKGMSLYEVRVYYNIYQEDYFNNKCDIKVLRFIEEQVKGVRK